MIKTARLIRRMPWLSERIAVGALNLSHIAFARGVAHREDLSDSELEEVLRAMDGKEGQAAIREVIKLYSECVSLPQDKVKPIRDGYSLISFAVSDELM